jgi:hypothetical protein
MKTTKQRFCAAGCLFILALSGANALAIEGLTINIQDDVNVVLGWPSVPGATYIIQSTPALNPSNGWETVTNFYPAATGTNWTTFVISNAISLSSSTGGGTSQPSGGPPTPTAQTKAASSVTLESGETMVPSTPWLPETMPSGAIVTASGQYVPYHPSAVSITEAVTPASLTPKSGSGKSSLPGQPGFYLVVQDGVSCVGLTNGAKLSGLAVIPLEIAVPTNDIITGAVLDIDGVMAPGGAASMGANNLWTFYWDTTEVPNGVHQLSAQVIFSEESVDVDVTNSMTVTVSNLITFPNYFASEVFGQGVGMWINAQCAVSNIDWEVAIYDSHTNYLGSLESQQPVANGNISVTWGLQTAANSPPLTDPYFRLDYYVFAAATGKNLKGGTNTAASKWIIGEAPWTPLNMLVACAPIDGNALHTAAITQMVLDGVVNVCANRMPGSIEPPANEQNGNAWTWGSNGDADTIIQAIQGCNYLYYFGHGTPYSFGMNSSNHVTYGDVVWALHNFPTNWGLTNLVNTNCHPYKLVWIDGCQSAGGPMCEAFSVPSGQFSTNFFNNAGVRSRAYVGYTKSISFNPDLADVYAVTEQNFWNGWFGEHSIHEIVTNCQAQVNGAMDKSAIIDGATNMFIGNY